MSRYDWPGNRDPGRRDKARNRGESIFEVLKRLGAQLRLEASAFRGQLLAALDPDSDTDVWVPMGPSETIRGQGGSQPRVAGRVRDLRVSDNGKRVYAATANGGVWYSGDGGDSWSPIGGAGSTAAGEAAAPGPSTLVTSCITVKFGANTDGSEDIVFAGTGELKPRLSGTPGGSNVGIGVLRMSRTIPQILNDPYVNPWTHEAANLAGTGIFRIALDPGDSDIAVAATSIGLFQRNNAGDWSRITVNPFDFDSDDDEWCTDVVWTATKGGVPERMWVALVDRTAGSDTGVWVSENGTAGPFTKVSLGGHLTSGRLGISIHKDNPAIAYVLGSGPRLWRIDGTTARTVSGIPEELFGSGSSDQSHYDLAVAVHPGNPKTVVVAGSTVLAEQTTRVVSGVSQLVGGSWSASLFRLTISGTAAADNFSCNFVNANQSQPGQDSNTFIGNNVHADVHTLRYCGAPDGSQLWVGCDGGVYRSLISGNPYSFRPRNKGLAVLESGYVAGHPTNDAIVITGTQDNGAQVAIGNTIAKLWRYGDGGGVAFHPTRPAHFIGQYTSADWEANQGQFHPPVFRLGVAYEAKDEVKAANKENDFASFYSDLDVISGVGDNARVVIGTNRVWISENWNPATTAPANTWVTLPSNSDPRALGETNIDQDIRDGSIQVVKWAGAGANPQNRVIALYEREIAVFNRAVDGSWTRIILEKYNEKCGDDEIDNDEISQPTNPFLPPLGAWSDLDVQNPATGTHGAFYVSTTGDAKIVNDVLVDSDRMDTLWWYNGTDTWFPTGLRSDANATKAAALAVAVDPADNTKVYVGTTVGVWRGDLTINNGTPSWQWQIFSNGLPDAIVQDLSFFRNGNLKLLRAALQARGIWEVDLSAAPSSPRLTYVRAHALDSRRQFPTVMTNPSDPNPAAPPHTYHNSPDIRIRPAPGSGLMAVPTSLPWRRTTGGWTKFLLWTLQTAMHEDDKLVRPTSLWTQQFDARIRHHRADLSLLTPNDPVVDAALWAKFVVNTKLWALPWDTVEASEADLYELIQEPFGGFEKTKMDNRETRVEVMVHHRHFQPLPPSQVDVLLLMRPVTSAEANSGAIGLSPVWKNTVIARLGGGAAALPDNWQQVGLGHPTNLLSARSPRAVTFNLDLSTVADFPVNSRWLMLAVVGDSMEPLVIADLAPNNVIDLVRGSHHVAAKRFRIRSNI